MRKPSIIYVRLFPVLALLLAAVCVLPRAHSNTGNSPDASPDRPPAEAQNLLVIGDSLSAAYGMEMADGWVALLDQRLKSEGYPASVVNSSVSGDTSANGLSRLLTLLEDYKPGIVIIELGGNDGLRGLSLKQMKSNLAQMVEQSRAAGAEVLILGMRIPSNYGAAYTRLFSNVFKQVAEDGNASLVPFFLSGMETSIDLFQDDGIHPSARAQPLLLENAWQELKPMLDRIYQ